MASISAVIPTWNGLEMLKCAVESLRRGRRVPDQVVIVDNGSSDGTSEWAKSEGLDVVRFPGNRGFAAAVNAGVEASRGELVFLLNNDIECEPDCLAVLEQAAIANEWAASFAPMITQWDSGLVMQVGVGLRPDFFAIPLGSSQPPGMWRRPAEVFGPSGAACLLRRGVLEAVGGFPEEFFAYYEDVDFAARCRLAGYRCMYVPEAVVRHIGAATSRRLGWRVPYMSARNQIWTLARCCPARLLPRLWKVLIRGQLVNLLTAAREGHLIPTALGKAAAILGIYRELRERSRIQRGCTSAEEFYRWVMEPVREL
ncbi:MAG: glycosyltransferase family 2 protein [Armatimonadetes bacterium]|nr:glycosyltransferase family 2 protein [Armatimonadota bacterium]